MNVRQWWRNCGVNPADEEVSRIDSMEDKLAPLSSDARAIRRLIRSLEMCHHKAERWVDLIIEAIASGRTTKGPGTRHSGTPHPAVVVWQDCVRTLSSWCNGMPVADDVQVGGISAAEFASILGERTALKIWQVQRVVEKIRSYAEPDTRYVEIVENEDIFAKESELRAETMSATIRDHVAGKPAEISLAAAIDHLEACHWDFIGNLMVVLNAIGGDLSPSRPYATCGRNINLSPIRPRMKVIADTLRLFWDESFSTDIADTSMLDVLGEKTPQKCWLAASLDKTIRLQFGL